jgi:hypothetical protein
MGRAAEDAWTAPTAELEFTAKGELRHAHLERGVEMQSEAAERLAEWPAAGEPDLEVAAGGCGLSR